MKLTSSSLPAAVTEPIAQAATTVVEKLSQMSETLALLPGVLTHNPGTLLASAANRSVQIKLHQLLKSSLIPRQNVEHALQQFFNEMNADSTVAPALTEDGWTALVQYDAHRHQVTAHAALPRTDELNPVTLFRLTALAADKSRTGHADAAFLLKALSRDTKQDISLANYIAAQALGPVMASSNVDSQQFNDLLLDSAMVSADFDSSLVRTLLLHAVLHILTSQRSEGAAPVSAQRHEKLLTALFCFSNSGRPGSVSLTFQDLNAAIDPLDARHLRETTSPRFDLLPAAAEVLADPEPSLAAPEEIHAVRLTRLQPVGSIQAAAAMPSAVKLAAPTAADLRALLATTPHETIRSIELTGNDYTAADIAALDSLPALAEIALIGEDALATDAYQAIGTLQRVRSLNLSKYKALQSGDLAIVNTMPSLRVLNVENRFVITDASLCALEGSQLTELNAGSCNVSDLSADLIGGLQQLKKLNLSGTKIGDKTVVLLPRLTKLEVLNISRCRQFSEMALAETIKGSPHLHLAVLDVTLCTQLGNALFENIAGNTSLRELFASNLSGLGDAGLSAIATCPSLEKIVLKYNKLGTDAGFAALATLPKLEYLDLSLVSKVSVTTIDAFARNGDSAVPVLHTLILDGCKTVDDAMLVSIGKHVPNLKKLVVERSATDTSNLRITNAGIHGLRPLQHLGELSLAYCKALTDEVADDIAAHTKLTMLNIVFCTGLTGATLQKIVGLPNLAEFHMSGCAFGDKDMAALPALSHLRHLVANDCRDTHHPQSNLTLAYVSQISTLEQVEMTGNPNLTKAGIVQINGLAHLHTARFYPGGPPVAELDADFPRIRSLHSGPLNMSRAAGRPQYLDRPAFSVTALAAD